MATREDNWAQDGADGAQNCPQDSTHYSQDRAEDGTCCQHTGRKTARAARKTARKPRLLKANLGQKEAKQQELSEEQMSHMKGGG